MKDGRAVVELGQAACCRSCGLCTAGGGGKMRLELDAPAGVEPGQAVTVGIDRSGSLVGILVLFGLPLAGLVVGAALGQARPIPGLSTDASSALLALAFLALAFLVALVCDRKIISKRISPPVILRIEPR